MRKYGSVPDLPPSAPSVSPNGGTFSGSATITLSTTTSGAAIRYTLDGTEPSLTNGSLYSDPFTITTSATVKAKAFLGTIGSRTTVASFISSTDFSPSSLSGLQLWLRGDAGIDPTDGYVNVWRDQSGHGHAGGALGSAGGWSGIPDRGVHLADRNQREEAVYRHPA